MRGKTSQAMGLADIKRRVMRRHLAGETIVPNVWMTWQAMGLADITRHFVGCREKRGIKLRVDDAALNPKP